MAKGAAGLLQGPHKIDEESVMAIPHQASNHIRQSKGLKRRIQQECQIEVKTFEP